MALVIEALFSIGLVTAAVWAASLWHSARRDHTTAQDALEQKERHAALEAALAEPGRVLRCIHCDHRFAGPMPEDGCPNCHLSTLVVPDDEDHSGNPAANGRNTE